MILSGLKYAERRIQASAILSRIARSFTSTSVVKEEQLADLDHCDLNLVTRYELYSVFVCQMHSTGFNLTINSTIALVLILQFHQDRILLLPSLPWPIGKDVVDI
jgi:hypothetical protein